MILKLFAALFILATASLSASADNPSPLGEGGPQGPGEGLRPTTSTSPSAATPAAEPELKPFTMPTLSVPGLVDLRPIFPGPRGKDLPAITISAGHFYAAGQPVRFWGVNLVFGACFPPHDVADKVAARLAAFGVNCVRFHHMDMQEFPNGIWAKDFRGLSPEALDRLDYLLAALKKEGVYANLNLHVSRDFSRTGGKMAADELTHYGKEVDLFDPELIALQKDYARDLLGHKNAYTGLTYAADPVTALVELTNEDSLFIAWSWYNFDPYSPRYEKELVALWNNWVAAKYKSDAALKAAWAAGEEPLGDNILGPRERQWTVTASGGAAAKAEEVQDGDEITIEKVTDTDWHVQYSISGVHLEKGKTYTLGFCADVDKPRTIATIIQQQNSPWRPIAGGKAFKLAPGIERHEYTFVAWADEPNAKIGFSLGQAKGQVTLAFLSLCPGGRFGLRDERFGHAEGESRDKKNIARMFPFEIATDARAADYFLFLADTERRYFSGMRDYLKNDLAVRAPITGTIGFGLLSSLVQAQEMDFVDAHDYWQGPHFPHKQWDARDWSIPNTAMVDDPQHSTLVQLAGTRVLYGSEKSAARPFTVTEYNHAAPNDYQAEGIPMIASFAAAQDWDGVFLFDYHASPDWSNQDAMRTFLSIDTNPVKMAELAAGALLFRRGDIAPLPVSVVTGLDHEYLSNLMTRHNGRTEEILSDTEVAAPPRVRFFGRYSIAAFDPHIDWQRAHPLTELIQPNKVFTLPPPDDTKAPVDWESADEKLKWTAVNKSGSGFYTAEGDRSLTVVGFIGGRKIIVGSTIFEVQTPKFAAITISALDGRPLEESKKVLVVASGRAENSGQKWNDSRTSVGDHWGITPTLIEPVTGGIGLIHLRSHMQITALDGKGLEIPKHSPIYFYGKGKGKVDDPLQVMQISLDPEAGTIWYVIDF